MHRCLFATPLISVWLSRLKIFILADHIEDVTDTVIFDYRVNSKMAGANAPDMVIFYYRII